MAFALRPYQEHACEAVQREWLFGGAQSTMLEMATGLGKTEVFVEIAKRFDDTRTLVVCPMIELISQAAKKFLHRTGVMPDIEQAQLQSNEAEWARNQFIVASKQTLTKERKDGSFRYQRLRDIGLVIVDECHLSITKPYQKMLDHFRSQGANVLGVTATAQRLDRLSMKNNYETCAYQYGITEAVPDGWLVGCRASCIQVQSLDLSKVNTVAGDFQKEQLAAALEDDKTMLEIAGVVAREGAGLKTVVYCASVAEARGVAGYLRDSFGVNASWVCGDKRLCTDQRRKEVLDSFTGDPGGIMVVCNVGVLTTGWDFPGLQHIVMARPTKSVALYTQVFGRGTRPLPGVVDFSGSTAESRLSAIAASAKPHFKMTDLVDNSLEHKIVTAANVMAGKLGLELIERVRGDIEKAGAALDLGEAIEVARKQLEFEAEERDRKKREQIRAHVEYHKVEVDPFDKQRSGSAVKGNGRVPRMIFGKHKGKPLVEIPLGYLKWVSKECKVKPWLAQAVQAELQRRTG